MPSVSAKQHRLMAAVASNPAVAKKTKIPQSVGKEFMQADKGKKFKQGGVAAVKQDINFTKENGMASKMNPGMMAMMKKKAPAKKMAMGGYADGGMPMVMKGGQKVPAFAADGKGKMAKGGMAASKMGAVKTAAPSRDGVAVKGKTKGTMVKMAGSTGMKRGGKC